VSAPGGLEARSLLQLRDEWLSHALSTAPADRPAAEEAVAQLYASIGRPPPEFTWVRSPAEAAKLLPAKEFICFEDDWLVVEAELAAQLSNLVQRMRERTDWQGAPSRIRRELRRTTSCLAQLVRSMMHDASTGVGWTGRRDTFWLAELDAQRLLGTRFDPVDLALFDLWETQVRSTGWWWAGEDVCVMAERPTVVRVDENSLPHNDDGPALEFADGSCAYAWHGTPTTPVSSARDPANPGFHLTLYDEMHSATRLLVVVNGSVERDGTRRRYGLSVPYSFQHPVEAAAWTYGLEAQQYSQLLRRT
jgi:hypothetical protein